LIVLEFHVDRHSRGSAGYRCAGQVPIIPYRCGIEFVRQPDADLGFIAFNWLTMGQLLSLPMVLLGVYLLWSAYKGQGEVKG